MSAIVHGRYGWNGLATTKIANADGRVGTVCDGESSGVCRFEFGRRRASRVLGIPEDCARGGELECDL